MLTSLKQQTIARGERLAVLHLSRLDEVAAELTDFAAHEELNGFQQWIVAHKYRLTPPTDLPFTPRSILLHALPHPFYANVIVEHGGQTHLLRSLVRADFEGAEAWLRAELKTAGNHLAAEPNLPFKRLGSHSLAAYGRTNITYIDGLGSNFSYAGYFSDLEVEQDDWLPQARVAPLCQTCKACLAACPTGAIRAERFLIDNERCLSYFNEVPDPFPAWIQPAWHNSLYDCLLCQQACPMNRAHLAVAETTYRFDESISAAILAGEPLTAFPPAFQAGAHTLGLDEWWPAIGKNLRVMIENQ
jgi:epoxyqueuosine reductase